jgi:hypothetical protein
MRTPRSAYAVFAVGTVLVGALAWTQRAQDDQPALVLLIVWAVAGAAHMLAADVRRASRIAAFGSVAVYVVVALIMGAANEMLLAGMVLVCIGGYVVARIMGSTLWRSRGAGGDVKP